MDLSICATLAWQRAAEVAGRCNHQFIDKEHILIGICELEEVCAKVALNNDTLNLILGSTLVSEVEVIDQGMKNCNLNKSKLSKALRERMGKGNFIHTERVIHRSNECIERFVKAQEIAELRKESEIRCVHLLMAILEQPGEVIESVLTDFQTTPEKLRLAFERLLDTPYLTLYGVDITAKAEDGKIDPVIGREEEIDDLVRILCQREKNNPVLIGDAGVGKTAIVEGLALLLARKENNIIKALGEKRIIQLDINAVVAGTIYRGQFEERLKKCLEEAKANPNVILFIDEIHTVIGAGRAGDSLDAADILKPALSRGEIKCIGATTIDEYRKYIENDSALERRFTPILVNEPTIAQTKKILYAIKPLFENYHKVSIDKEAIEAAVELSAQYLLDRRLPDKAKDLLDEACSYAKLHNISEVDRETIASILSHKTGIPVTSLNKSESEKLLNMADQLKKRVIGQDEAVEAIVSAIKRSRTMLRDKNRPIGVFYFVGPTGVGKTYLAKTIADYYFGSEEALIRIDMSEYQEHHTISRLIGAPPGYVGYGEEGELTGALRRRPYSVVLLDEIEKAHPDVINLFLRLFDEGRITDSKGRTIDATNAVFIMTSNLSIEPERRAGFRTRGTGIDDIFRNRLVQLGLPREFVNRIDRIILFNKLSKEDVKKITRKFIEQLRERVEKEWKLLLQVEEDAVEFISKIGFDEEFGARPLRRAIEREIEEPLAELLLKGAGEEGDIILVSYKEEKIQIEFFKRTKVGDFFKKEALQNTQEVETKLLEELYVEVECLQELSYSLLNAEIPFLSKIKIFNKSPKQLEGFKLKIELPDYAYSDDVDIPPIEPGSSYEVDKLPRLNFVIKQFESPLEAKNVELKVLWDGKHCLKLDSPVEVKIFPMNAWCTNKHPQALAGFVVSRCNSVNYILSIASKRLPNGINSFAEALMSSNIPEREIKVIRAIYDTLNFLNIKYEHDPRNYSENWQIIRSHKQVLETSRSGNCIDLALLFSACLEEIYLDPIIIIVKLGISLAHALIGCWKERSPFIYKDCVIKEKDILLEFLEKGDLVIIDSSPPSEDAYSFGLSFENSIDQAQKFLSENDIVFAIDIVPARYAGIMPFEKEQVFDHSVLKALFKARQLLPEVGSSSEHCLAVGSRHILLALLESENSLLKTTLLEIGGESLVNNIMQATKKGLNPLRGLKNIHMWETDTWRKVMDEAEQIRSRELKPLITEEILMKALLRNSQNIKKILSEYKVNEEELIEKLEEKACSLTLGIRSTWSL